MGSTRGEKILRIIIIIVALIAVFIIFTMLGKTAEVGSKKAGKIVEYIDDSAKDMDDATKEKDKLIDDVLEE